MSRSVWKPPFVDSVLQRRVGDESAVATWSRKTYIVPEFVGKVFEIHNGNRFIRLRVGEDMVGHKLGEFAPTRKACAHKH
ncbi:MAG: 30S ribosomal protein S19 [Candidatus Hodgkinia cicadicola]|nr:MAG: 30S ribosomal protein S19 [Candidatus Hodgkinia cicadicola]